MKAFTLMKQLAEIKSTAIEAIKEKLNGLNHVFVTDEELNECDYSNGSYINIRNDFGKIYDVLLVAIENGTIITLNHDTGEKNPILLDDFDGTDDLVAFLLDLETDLESDLESDLELLRHVSTYTLVKKGNQYYVDNGDDVSEYFDKLEALAFIEANDADFVTRSRELFD